MPSKIRVLDEHTINKIAAGEVIENPASVVKELLDNALDAKATEITVEIRSGGRGLIRITDNGCGMDSDDALLSLERHATSKLKSIEDLEKVQTMGFRGEAIPSIASISKFSLHTKASNEGTLLLVEGGRILSRSEAPRDQGTTIEIKDLFFNVPVRRKFQRSPTYDALEVQKIVTIAALSHEKINFELINNGKKVFATTGENRITDLLGDQLYKVDETKGVRRLRGYIGFPTENRPNRTGQYLFVNNRPVHSPLMSFAVKEGYGTSLPTNRHPVFVLFLDLPPESVDVNVHPQKKEVRFQQTPDLRDFVFSAIDHTLQQTGVVESFVYQPISPPSFSYQPQTFPEIKVEEPVEAYMPELFEEKITPAYKVLHTLKHYLLVEFPEGDIAFVDVKAAHARILFEQMEKNIPVESQILLLPIEMKLSPEIVEILPDLEALGFSIKMGDRTFSIDAVPQFLQNADCEAVVSEMLETSTLLHKERRKKIVALASRTACPSLHLVTALMECKNSDFCPLGKPTIWKLNENEIKKQFKKTAETIERTGV